MDMGFHVISSVARTLFDDYKKLKYQQIWKIYLVNYFLNLINT
jgi:hypothetical protein